MAAHALEKVHDPSTFLLLGPRKADVEGYFGAFLPMTLKIKFTRILNLLEVVWW